MSWSHPNPDAIRAALSGPHGEVLRTIAIQPKKSGRYPPAADVRIPIARSATA